MISTIVSQDHPLVGIQIELHSTPPKIQQRISPLPLSRRTENLFEALEKRNLTDAEQSVIQERVRSISFLPPHPPIPPGTHLPSPHPPAGRSSTQDV